MSGSQVVDRIFGRMFLVVLGTFLELRRSLGGRVLSLTILCSSQQYGCLNKTQTMAKTNARTNMEKGNLKRLLLLDEEL